MHRPAAAITLAGWVAVGAFGCAPKTVRDAERTGDVAWLDAEGSGEAVAALGRLADKDARAVQALDARADRDVNAYIAAWAATMRGATWGAATLRTGLGNPLRAEETASVMTRSDPHIAPFVPDLEAALVRLAGSRRDTAIAAVLASAGAPADAAVARRLEDSSTRGAICRGIGAPDASPSAHRTLTRVASGARDDESCVEAVLINAVTDDVTLEWLATAAEPGLLSSAGSRDAFPCPRLARVWTQAFVARPPAQQSALTVPLRNAIGRCARVVDPVLAAAIAEDTPAYDLIVGGLDPFGTQTQDLPKTCAALKPRAGSRGNAFSRERSRAALSHGCVFAK
jgi:hypothetical protein